MRRVAICGPRTIAGTAEHAKPHHSFTVNSSRERRHIHATTPQVTAAPAITDGTVPSSFAARPDSNAPSSFDELMKIPLTDRKRGVEGKSVSVRVDLGGRRIIKKKKENQTNQSVMN